MKTLFIIYHEDLEPQVRGILHRGMIVARYTRIDGVVGARMAQMEAETGYMTDRRNRIITVIAEDKAVNDLVKELRDLRNKEGHGLRGFVVDTDTVF
jgi:hypothetical protein